MNSKPSHTVRCTNILCAKKEIKTQIMTRGLITSNFYFALIKGVLLYNNFWFCTTYPLYVKRKMSEK